MGNIAIIPARGGSKRIPHKNIKHFCGKPMIAWSIEAALASGLFEHVVVSTDDEAIAQIARQYGAITPFARPKELSDDFTATRPVVIHAINAYTAQFSKPAFVCCLYATAPFVTAKILQQGFDALQNSTSDFVFTVTSFPSAIQRALKILPNGTVEMFYPEHRLTRSQDLEPAYHDAGQFYWGNTQAFLDNLPTFSPRSTPLILPRSHVQDIDNLEDWDMAEHMFASLNR